MGRQLIPPIYWNYSNFYIYPVCFFLDILFCFEFHNNPWMSQRWHSSRNKWMLKTCQCVLRCPWSRSADLQASAAEHTHMALCKTAWNLLPHCSWGHRSNYGCSPGSAQVSWSTFPDMGSAFSLIQPLNLQTSSVNFSVRVCLRDVANHLIHLFDCHPLIIKVNTKAKSENFCFFCRCETTAAGSVATLWINELVLKEKKSDCAICGTLTQ